MRKSACWIETIGVDAARGHAGCCAPLINLGETIRYHPPHTGARQAERGSEGGAQADQQARGRH